MGSVYRRKDSPFWWVAYKDATGTRLSESTGTEDEEAARSALEELERKVEAQKALNLKAPGPVTASMWLEKWAGDRKPRLSSAASQERWLKQHVMPHIGHMPLEKIRSQHIQAVVDEIGKTLSSRSVNLIYGSIRTMFRHAVKKGLINASPCVLTVRDGDLPKPRDAKAGWRAGAVFTRMEIAQIIYSPRLLEAHRVLWALMFLTGMRIGEVVARRWSDIVPDEPLPKLYVRSSYSAKHRTYRIGGKTEIDREVPVLPQLGTILDAWRDTGRPEYVAKLDRPWRKKAPVEDFIVPGPRGGVLSGNTTWRWMQDDLALLGLRPRRQHDTRRTFYSLVSADGARPDVGKLVVWGVEPSVAGRYLTMPWPVVCAEISKLHIPSLAESIATPRYAPSNPT